jgi:hypothetical protein
MTAFCLIHGSGQGPEGWKLLLHELESYIWRPIHQNGKSQSRTVRS